ncbi:hypothetical protein G7Y89_g12958 [Cudoniella acicularis]|uniref:Pentatricopeptide repeat protein n=1 Tax=Cudoniella acicularis TaxID=354080 RepID=A0A8H4VWI5_9HELO|nr:hypothetical protein G7Y89_g12958 [Cudoniella acicularis]
MPPPQPFLAYRLGGFVCKSCLSKIRTLQRRPLPWLARSITNNQGPKPPKRGTSPPSQHGATVRYFEETPDGDRRELIDEDLDAYIESMGPGFKEFEAHQRNILHSTKDDPGGFESFEDQIYETIGTNEGMEDVKDQAFLDSIEEDEPTKDITSANEKLETLLESVKRLSDKDVISEEDKLKIRELLFNFASGSNDKKSMNLNAESRPVMPPSIAQLMPPAPPIKTPTHLSYKFPRKRSENGKFDTLDLEAFPKAYERHLSSLQIKLALAASREKHKQTKSLRGSVWKSYLMCRSALISFPRNVPRSIWSGLWAVLSSTDSSEYVDRMAHIKYLGDDLKKVNVPIKLEQCLLYVEALLVQGDLEVAIREWDAIKTKAKNSEHVTEHCELGVKLFCQQGDLDQALRTADTLLSNTSDPTTFRILLPIIQTCLASRDIKNIQLAWALYVRLQVNMGSRMVMSDYDTIILSCLEAGQADLALGAFKDMMPEIPQNMSSVAIYKKFTDAKGLNSITIENKELDFRNSRALTSLPPSFNNKFFFGKWLKKLIGEDELEAARKVLDLMNERGIRPDARHVNGLIGAWVRKGTTKSLEMAEDMAWKMINARLSAVKDREEYPGRHSKKRSVYSFNNTDDGKKKGELWDLFNTLGRAKIRPNTYFMNELLSMDTKTDHQTWAWKTYIEMTENGAIQPDFETFTVLWHSLCKLSARVLRTYHERPLGGFPMPRSLFAEMIKHKVSLGKEGKIPRDLYESIILCFSLAEDQAGTAVALRALQENFGLYPNEETARTIILQLSRLSQTNEVGYKTRRLNTRNRETKDRVARVTKIFHQFKQERDEALLRQGIVFEKLSDERKLEEALLVLSDLLRHAFQTKIMNEERKIYTAPQVSKRAAEQMGVPTCVPWLTNNAEETI